MTTSRDWLATLWPASYMGVAFFFDSDDEKGGRGLKVHEFPGRDDPFVEDLGQKARYFEGAAYIHGDDVDTQALDLTETFASRGPGTLVIPLLGPIEVHCEEFTRKHEKDKLGYVAYQVRFVRAGAAQSLISVTLAGQLVFDQADALSLALANLFPAALTLLNQADYVVAAAIGGFEGIAAAIETVRLANAVDPDVSVAARDAASAILTASPLLISPGAVDPGDVSNLLADVPPLDELPAFAGTGLPDPTATLAASVIATIRALVAGMDGAAAASAMLEFAAAYPAAEPSLALSASAAAAAANAEAVTALARLAALTAWAEALQRQSYASRPDGIAARAAAAERFELELGRATGAANHSLYVALTDLRGAVVSYLTQLIADLAPIVTVSAARQMPALWWAWRLYGDPARAVDLVLRNQVRHPSLMPLSFEALAPGFAAAANLAVVWPAA
jgi:prophage DNA circulation protein